MEQDMNMSEPIARGAVTSLEVKVVRSVGDDVLSTTVGVEQYGPRRWMVLLEEGEVWTAERGMRGLPAAAGSRGPVFERPRFAAEAAFLIGEQRCIDELNARLSAGADEEPEGAA